MIKTIKLLLASAIAILFFNSSAFAGGHYTGPDLSGQKVTMFGPWLAPEDATMREVMDIFSKATGAEVEYGGSDETKNVATYNTSYQRRVYLEDGYNKLLKKLKFDDSQLYFFRYPENKEDEKIVLTHWSYFEAWDSYRNYVVAKEHCGLSENEFTNKGTFTNFAQNDQAFYALHAYMMYLKFGFGRATQDAGIEIRRGAMSRDQAINLVNLYDNHYPSDFEDLYLSYYNLSKDEFDKVLDKWVNKNLFEKIDGFWMPRFNVGEKFNL